MIPENEIKIDDIDITDESSGSNRTFLIDNSREVIEQSIDDRIAIEQAIYKILSTERYKHPIYSWNYGVELEELFGKPRPFVRSELKRRIEEALYQDERVQDITDFKVEFIKNMAICTFAVVTDYGDIAIRKEADV